MLKKIQLLIAVLLSCATMRAMAQDCSVTVTIRGVHDAKLSISKFSNGRYGQAFETVSDVSGQTVLRVPKSLLPGQFLLRMDYRKKETDNPYPSEFIFFLNKENIGLGINPLATQLDSIVFQNDNETPLYYSFMNENAAKKRQLALVGQVLESYNDRAGKFYKEAATEFEKQRVLYNKWIDEQTAMHRTSMVSHLFPIQKIGEKNWFDSVEKQALAQQNTYFDFVDLKDSTLLHFQDFSDFVTNYVSLFGMRVTNESLRDSLFTQAGRLACQKFSSGHPKLYGWVVDYFYRGYEGYNILPGINMLQQFINDPNCLTSKKQEIMKRLEGMKKLKIGAPAPAFEAEMFDGMKLRFDGVSKQKKYELVIFYESGCGHCNELLAKLANWYKIPENQIWVDIITVSVDDKRASWELAYQQNNFQWYNVWAPEGINSKAANDYYILSTPVIFIIDKEMKIQGMPVDMEGINRFFNQ